MITFKTGDIFRSKAEALVNPVNCVGVMGAGLALQFKWKYLDNFKLYEAACKQGEVVPGQMHVTEPPKRFGPMKNLKYIVNFPTKRHWKDESRLEDIQEGLKDLARVIQDKNIQSIAIPPLGCGLGGLNWKQVRPLIEALDAEFPGCSIEIYKPKS